MNRGKRHIVFFILLVFACILIGYWIRDYLTLENLGRHKELLQGFVQRNYTLSIALFVSCYICTGFFLPHALVLTIAAGYLFGTLRGALFVIVGGTVGSTLSFLTSRYLAGNWIHRKYKDQLEKFNAEIKTHGIKYLIVMRFVPLFPFFLVNYFAGMTRIPLLTYMAITFFAMLPGAVVYAFAGHRLATVSSVKDIFSPGMVAALLIIAALFIIPVLIELGWRLWKRRG